MSIATEITRLQNAKSALKSAIESKGVTVPSSTKLDGYASLVSSIPGIVPTGTINITENGENIDIEQYATANVNIAGTEATISDWVVTKGTESLYDENDELIPFKIKNATFHNLTFYNIKLAIGVYDESAIIPDCVDETYGTWILLMPVGGVLWTDLTKFTAEVENAPIEIKQIQYASEITGDPPYGVAIRIVPTGDLSIKYNGQQISYITKMV